MARPTARVLALLELLQSGGIRTVAELARRLGVDERTVRRYVGHLIDLDVPVESVRGRYGGYRLAPGYRMPPLMLTDDEALATLLGLVAGRQAGLVTSSALAAESAIAKLRRVLPRALGRRLDALLEMTDFTAQEAAAAGAETRVLLAMAEAARDRHPVAIRYRTRDGRSGERTVQPYGLVAHSRRWYLTGADSVSGEVRTFRLDRITDPQVLPGAFELPRGFDPAAHVLAGLARAPHAHDVSVRVQGTPARVRSVLPEGLAVVAELGPESPAGPAGPDENGPEENGPDENGPDAGGGWCRVLIHAERLEWIPAALAALGCPFVIERPDELRDLVRDLAELLARSASAA